MNAIDKELLEKLQHAIEILAEVEKMLEEAAEDWKRKNAKEKTTDGRN